MGSMAIACYARARVFLCCKLRPVDAIPHPAVVMNSLQHRGYAVATSSAAWRSGGCVAHATTPTARRDAAVAARRWRQHGPLPIRRHDRRRRQGGRAACALRWPALATGWQVIHQAGDNRTAWSAWQLPEDGWHGLLIVLNPSRRRRTSQLLRVEADDEEHGAGVAVATQTFPRISGTLACKIARTLKIAWPCCEHFACRALPCATRTPILDTSDGRMRSTNRRGIRSPRSMTLLGV